MKRETITQALGGLDDRFVSEAAVYAPGTMQEGPERIVRMKKKRFLSIVLAAALILALGITAYAAWSTHAARQEEIKADLKIEDLDLIEANEAFAAQSIAVARELHFDMSKVNVNGGAIALGHPVGASGARIIVTLLHEMLKRDDAKKGLATLCIGGGQGVATIFEKC